MDARHGLAASMGCLLVLSGIAVWMAQPPVLEPELLGFENRWGPGDAEGATLLTVVTLRNPNGFAIPMKRVGFDIVVDGKVLGRGASDGPVTLAPRANTTVELRSHIPTQGVVDAWVGHAGKEGPVAAEVRGQAVVDVLGLEVAFPFERERAWDASLTKLLGGAGSTCEPGLPAPCVASSEHAIAEVTAEATRIASTLTLRNPLPRAVPLSSLTLEVVSQGVVLAKGTSDRAVELPAGGEAAVPVTTVVQHDALAAWWPLHVQGCEASPAELRATLVSPILGGVPFTATRGLPAITTHVAC